MQQIKPMEPQRGRDGYWTHPDVPVIETTEQFNAWQAEQGFQCSVVMLDGDDGVGSEDAQKRYFEDGDTDILVWQPSKPEGEGWFIVSIHDTEDGPACLWIRYPTEELQNLDAQDWLADNNRRAAMAIEAIMTGTEGQQRADDEETPEDETIDLEAADFSDALMWLKEGKRVARAVWPRSKRLYLHKRSVMTHGGNTTETNLRFETSNGGGSWIPDSCDLLATDWQVV